MAAHQNPSTNPPSHSHRIVCKGAGRQRPVGQADTHHLVQRLPLQLACLKSRLRSRSQGDPRCRPTSGRLCRRRQVICACWLVARLPRRPSWLLAAYPAGVHPSAHNDTASGGPAAHAVRPWCGRARLSRSPRCTCTHPTRHAPAHPRPNPGSGGGRAGEYANPQAKPAHPFGTLFISAPPPAAANPHVPARSGS